MRIKTLFFASYRDLTGTPSVEVDLEEGASISQLVGRLRARGGGWERLPATPTVAVNQKYVRGDRVLHPGDEVGADPPVAGG